MNASRPRLLLLLCLFVIAAVNTACEGEGFEDAVDGLASKPAPQQAETRGVRR